VGGFFIAMFQTPSVVIEIINIVDAVVGKTENHSPVCANGYCPKTLPFAFEWMQRETGHIHIGHNPGRVQPRARISHSFARVRGNHTTWIVVLMETLQSLVATPRCFGGDRKAMDIAWKALELRVKHSGRKRITGPVTANGCGPDSIK
jgi:hypothetical protein